MPIYYEMHLLLRWKRLY